MRTRRCTRKRTETRSARDAKCLACNCTELRVIGNARSESDENWQIKTLEARKHTKAHTYPHTHARARAHTHTHTHESTHTHTKNTKAHTRKHTKTCTVKHTKARSKSTQKHTKAHESTHTEAHESTRKHELGHATSIRACSKYTETLTYLCLLAQRLTFLDGVEPPAMIRVHRSIGAVVSTSSAVNRRKHIHLPWLQGRGVLARLVQRRSRSKAKSERSVRAAH
jgi:hypothetical protein